MKDDTTGNIAFGVSLALGVSHEQALAMLRRANLREPKGARFQPKTPHWLTQAEAFEHHLADVLPRLGLNIPMRLSTTPTPTAFDVLSSRGSLLYTNQPGTEYIGLIGLPSGTFSTLYGHLKDGAPHVGGYPVSRTVQPIEALRKSFTGLVLKSSFLIGSRTKPDDLFAEASHV